MSNTEKWWIDSADLSKMNDNHEIWNLHRKYDKLDEYLFAKMLHHCRGMDKNEEGSTAWLHHAAMLHLFESDKKKVVNVKESMHERMELNRSRI